MNRAPFVWGGLTTVTLASFLISGNVSAETTACPGTLKEYAGKVGSLTCNCAPDSFKGEVWGTSVYTHDSSVCSAALHAGEVAHNGGEVTVHYGAGRNYYLGAIRNGIKSDEYSGQWPTSFAFIEVNAIPAFAPQCDKDFQKFRGTSNPVTCTCPTKLFTGRVWGTDVYTDDSSVCQAAVHASVVLSTGGTIVIWPTQGQESYPASARNGVETLEWTKPFPASFTFIRPGSSVGQSSGPAAGDEAEAAPDSAPGS